MDVKFLFTPTPPRRHTGTPPGRGARWRRAPTCQNGYQRICRNGDTDTTPQTSLLSYVFPYPAITKHLSKSILDLKFRKSASKDFADLPGRPKVVMV